MAHNLYRPAVASYYTFAHISDKNITLWSNSLLWFSQRTHCDSIINETITVFCKHYAECINIVSRKNSGFCLYIQKTLGFKQ